MYIRLHKHLPGPFHLQAQPLLVASGMGWCTTGTADLALCYLGRGAATASTVSEQAIDFIDTPNIFVNCTCEFYRDRITALDVILICIPSHRRLTTEILSR